MERKIRFAVFKQANKTVLGVEISMVGSPVYMGHIIANNLREAEQKAKAQGFYVDLDNPMIQQRGPVQELKETGEWVPTNDFPR